MARLLVLRPDQGIEQIEREDQRPEGNRQRLQQRNEGEQPLRLGPAVKRVGDQISRQQHRAKRPCRCFGKGDPGYRPPRAEAVESENRHRQHKGQETIAWVHDRPCCVLPSPQRKTDTDDES